jgi:hypothetical protein
MSQMLRVLLYSQEIAENGGKVPFVGFDGRVNDNVSPTRIIPSGFECAFIDGKLRPFTHTALLIPGPELVSGATGDRYMVVDEISAHFPDTVRMYALPAKYIKGKDGLSVLEPLPVVVDRDHNAVNQEIWKGIGYDPNNTQQSLPDVDGKNIFLPTNTGGHGLEDPSP